MEVISELRPKGHLGKSVGKSIPGRGNSRCEGSRLETSLGYSNKKATSTAK